MRRTAEVTLFLNGLIFIIALISTIYFLPTRWVTAHPGNTAADECHYCRTNCDYWGEVYGERHCHGGSTDGEVGYSGPTYAEQGTSNGANHASTVNRSYIGESAQNEGASDGRANGQSDTLIGESSSGDTFCSEQVKFDTPQDSSYVAAFQASYKSTCIPIYNAAYSASYTSAYTAAQHEKASKNTEADQTTASPENDSGNSGLYWLGGLVAFYGTLTALANTDAIRRWLKEL